MKAKISHLLVLDYMCKTSVGIPLLPHQRVVITVW